MTKEEIIKGNKLIADFIGLKLEDGFYTGDFNPILNEEHEGCVRMNLMRFHKSWDWLMPVIEKISDLDEVLEVSLLLDNHAGCKSLFRIMSKYNWYTSFYRYIVRGKFKNRYNIKSPKYCCNSIDSAYYSVLEFIKIHNEAIR